MHSQGQQQQVQQSSPDSRPQRNACRRSSSWHDHDWQCNTAFGSKQVKYGVRRTSCWLAISPDHQHQPYALPMDRSLYTSGGSGSCFRHINERHFSASACPEDPIAKMLRTDSSSLRRQGARKSDAVQHQCLYIWRHRPLASRIRPLRLPYCPSSSRSRAAHSSRAALKLGNGSLRHAEIKSSLLHKGTAAQVPRALNSAISSSYGFATSVTTPQDTDESLTRRLSKV